MKNTLLSACAIVMIALSTSCKKLSELTKFDLKYSTEATIQSGVGTFLPFDINTPEMTTESEDQFQGHNTSKNLVESVTLKDIKISIISPEDKTFDFLKDIEVYISAEGQQEVKVASKMGIPDNAGKEVVLDIAKAELKPYLTSDKFKLRLKTTTDKVLNSDVQIKISNTFRVDANVLGL